MLVSGENVQRGMEDIAHLGKVCRFIKENPKKEKASMATDTGAIASLLTNLGLQWMQSRLGTTPRPPYQTTIIQNDLILVSKITGSNKRDQQIKMLCGIALTLHV